MSTRPTMRARLIDKATLFMYCNGTVASTERYYDAQEPGQNAPDHPKKRMGNCDRCYRIGDIDGRCHHGHQRGGRFVAYYCSCNESTNRYYINPALLAIALVHPDDNTNTHLVSASQSFLPLADTTQPDQPLSNDIVGRATCMKTFLEDIATTDDIRHKGCDQFKTVHNNHRLFVSRFRPLPNHPANPRPTQN